MRARVKLSVGLTGNDLLLDYSLILENAVLYSLPTFLRELTQSRS